MRHWGEVQDRKARIEIIPMIDVMLFLLVFFVLSLNVMPAFGIETTPLSSSVTPDLQTQNPARVTLPLPGEIHLNGYPKVTAKATSLFP